MPNILFSVYQYVLVLILYRIDNILNLHTSTQHVQYGTSTVGKSLPKFSVSTSRWFDSSHVSRSFTFRSNLSASSSSCFCLQCGAVHLHRIE